MIIPISIITIIKKCQEVNSIRKNEKGYKKRPDRHINCPFDGISAFGGIYVASKIYID